MGHGMYEGHWGKRGVVRARSEDSWVGSVGDVYVRYDVHCTSYTYTIRRTRTLYVVKCMSYQPNTIVYM